MEKQRGAGHIIWKVWMEGFQCPHHHDIRAWRDDLQEFLSMCVRCMQEVWAFKNTCTAPVSFNSQRLQKCLEKERMRERNGEMDDGEEKHATHLLYSSTAAGAFKGNSALIWKSIIQTVMREKERETLSSSPHCLFWQECKALREE